MLPKCCLKAHPKSIFYYNLVENWDPLKGLKYDMAVFGQSVFYDFFGFGCQRAERSLPKAHHEAKKYEKVPKSMKNLRKVLEIC